MTDVLPTIDGADRKVAIRFDYASLPDDIAKHALAAAHRIRRHEQKATEAMLEIGRDLIAIKGMLDHGQFVRWVEAECSSAVRTIQNYMKAAEAFEGKYATVAHLPPATVYALAAAPADTRAGLLERIKEGERLTEETVKNVLWDVRQEKKQAAQNSKLTPAQRKAKARREAKADEQRKLDWAQRQKRDDERRRAERDAGALIAAKMHGEIEELIALLEASRHYQGLIDAVRAPLIR